MKIVIDIPNWLYNAIIGHREPVYSQSLGDAVREGTPLPKGHGDLIDRKALMENAYTKGFCSWYDEIEMADTIIEADMTEGGGGKWKKY